MKIILDDCYRQVNTYLYTKIIYQNAFTIFKSVLHTRMISILKE